MSPASFDEELTFDTVAWWYRTEPCSTSAPVSVLGPWLLPPALTDLLHGITMTLCTHKARVGVFFNYFRDACLGNTRMSHVCRLRVRRGRSESTAATSQAQVCGTGVEGDRGAAPFLCLSPSSSKPAQATAPLPSSGEGPLSMARCPALGYFIAPAGSYLARTRRIFREQVCRRQRGWVSAGV